MSAEIERRYEARMTDSTCYIERSAMRELILSHPDWQASSLLGLVDGLKIFNAADFAAQADAPTIDSVPSCGQENDYRRGKAFHQIAHDEGAPDLASLWQAVIDNTKGSGFWLGEILLTTIEQETGFNGSAHTRPDHDSQSALKDTSQLRQSQGE